VVILLMPSSPRDNNGRMHLRLLGAESIIWCLGLSAIGALAGVFCCFVFIKFSRYLERPARLELARSAWRAEVLPVKQLALWLGLTPLDPPGLSRLPAERGPGRRPGKGKKVFLPSYY
jgi:hypothetical protein